VDGTRLSRLGLPRLAKEACVHQRNIGIIIRRLIQKKSIEIYQKEVSDLRTARSYRVFAYHQILERRKAAGLEWVVRGRGVEFVDASTHRPIFKDTVHAGPLITAGDAVSAGETPAVTASESPAITAGETPAVTAGLLGNIFLGNLEEQYSSSSEITQTLRRHGTADDDAARQLIQACQSRVLDCTSQEIIHFIEQKAALLRTGRIANPIGFLLASVPKCFEGEAFQLYREQVRKRLADEAARREREEAEIEQWRREQQAILNDPDASEQDKCFARQMLGLS
jgi:hypothetical protein